MPNGGKSGSGTRDSTLLEIEGLRIAIEEAGGAREAGRTEDALPVDGLRLYVGSGEFVALVGASGSGKTLTALAAVGLLPPGVKVSGGSVRLHGKELLGQEEKDWRRVRGGHIAMIFQEPKTSLNPTMTIGAQLREAITRHLRCSRRDARRIAEESLRAVQMPEPRLRLRAYPHQLSGGLRQRAMIATALSCRPELLIADEPTTALDVTVQAGIVDLLQRLRGERGLAILLITHDIALAAEAVDRIVVIEKGRTVDEGSAAEIVSRPRHPYTVRLIEHCRRRERWRESTV